MQNTNASNHISKSNFPLIYGGIFEGDFNDDISVAYYRIDNHSTTVNGPGLSWAVFIQFNAHNAQVVINSSNIAFRTKTGNPSVWNNWKKL